LHRCTYASADEYLLHFLLLTSALYFQLGSSSGPDVLKISYLQQYLPIGCSSNWHSMIFKKFIFTLNFLISTTALNAQSDNYIFYKANNNVSKHEWILLLPGSSGLIIFEDSTFYHRKAEFLNQLGYDILLLDYKRFYQTSTLTDKPKGNTGEKISWVVKQVIQIAKEKQQIENLNKGHIIGWSLAGEAVFKLLKDTTFVSDNKLKSVALYYPSNNEKLDITTTIPLLIQIGQIDKTVNADNLQKQIKSSEKIKFLTYQNSFHGFDVETITQPKTIKFPPVIGKKHTFYYNKEASEKSLIELIAFLK
jgi:dienelactone hydrolase